MKLYSLSAALAMLTLASAWDIKFTVQKGDKTKTFSDRGVGVRQYTNIPAYYDWNTTSIRFNDHTNDWIPNGYIAFIGPNCQGSSFHGKKGNTIIRPGKRLRSFRVR